MKEFFTVSDNSFRTRGFVWISCLVEGFGVISQCKICGTIETYASGDMVAEIELYKGVKWPDIVGCGHFPFFIVSERVIDCWNKENIGSFPLHKVTIRPPYPKRLTGMQAPLYYWLDGYKMRGASLDFEASGFIGVKFCPECGIRSEDQEATFWRRHANVCPYVFRPSSWNSSNLFTTDLVQTVFFCTGAVVDCARKYKLTNFRFVPIQEAGGNDFRKDLKYLK